MRRCVRWPTAQTPVPLPESAENVKFDGADGRLEFNSSSSVKALAAFYRASLKAQGWKEQPSVINKPNMVVMEFSKGGKAMSFTAMQMGPKVNVSADGSGLVMANAECRKHAAKHARQPAQPAAKATDEPLEADPDSALPVPKQRTHDVARHRQNARQRRPVPPGTRSQRSGRSQRRCSPSIAANSASAAGRKRPSGAVVKPDQVQLAFASPDGPAVLKLGRSNGETSVNLAQKYPAAAAKADVMPKPGQARLMFGNIGRQRSRLTINKQTIKIAAGAGGPQSPKRPMLDLPPGKYQYSVKVAGRPAGNDTIEIAADDAWGLMVAPERRSAAAADVLSAHGG